VPTGASVELDQRDAGDFLVRIDEDLVVGRVILIIHPDVPNNTRHLDEARCELHLSPCQRGGRAQVWAEPLCPDPHPLYESYYGATKPSENWADAFAMYVLGMPLPDELKAVLDEAR
jgi:hypothetical protein